MAELVDAAVKNGRKTALVFACYLQSISPVSAVEYPVHLDCKSNHSPKGRSGFRLLPDFIFVC